MSEFQSASVRAAGETTTRTALFDARGQLTAQGLAAFLTLRAVGVDIEKVPEAEAAEIVHRAGRKPVEVVIRYRQPATPEVVTTAQIVVAAKVAINVPDPEPEPVVDAEPEPVAVAEPVVDAEPEPVAVAEPVVDAEPEPEPIPVVEAAPVVVAEPEPVVETAPAVKAPVEAAPAVVDAARFPPPAHGKYKDVPITPRRGQKAQAAKVVAPPPPPTQPRALTKEELLEQLGRKWRRR